MENHFEICMTEDQLRGISSIGLAHMGDAVFELLVRGCLLYTSPSPRDS